MRRWKMLDGSSEIKMASVQCKSNKPAFSCLFVGNIEDERVDRKKVSYF